jgi:tRNA acetyltransferase TAN1
MLHDFNLLITTPRGNEVNACQEAWYLLNQIGDSDPKTDTTPVKGIITAKTTLPFPQVIRDLRSFLKEHPRDFSYTLRVIPIQKTVPTDLAEIGEAATHLAQQLQPEETFRITVEKRFTSIPTKALVEAAAKNIPNRVNLTSPNKVIIIEVVGKTTGLSILRPTDIMSTPKERPPEP